MFNYHGRDIRINEELMADYKYYVGTGLTEQWADLYVFNRFVETSDNPLSMAATLPNEELEEIIASGMRNEIRQRM